MSRPRGGAHPRPSRRRNCCPSSSPSLCAVVIARHSAVAPRTANADAWRAAGLHGAASTGVSVWVDFPLARDARDRRAEAADRGGRGRRRHLEPDDLREGARRRRPVRRAASSRARARPTTRRRSSSRSRSRTSSDACDLLPPVWDRTNGVDGYRLARGRSRISPTSASARSSRRSGCTELVDRQNLYVKIPATEPGHRRDRGLDRARVARSTSRSSSRSSATLPSPRRTSAGLERLGRGGRRPDERRSRWRASSSRASTPEADRRLAEIGRERPAGAPRGRQREARRTEHYLEVFSVRVGTRSQPTGASPQRCLWASTSTKNPALPRRALRRGADRPEHGEHDAVRDDRGVPGPR